MFWDWGSFFIGLFSGGFIGISIMAMCNIASSADERMNRK